MRYVVLHGHFYQPPRENPWIEEIEVQDSAAPYHDWNERIHAECYGPNSASRIMAQGGGIIDICNNYQRISFNFGPTLLAWMERKAPDTYRRVLEAGGNAIAQAYNHAILPLCNRRDKRTQIRWGKRDFEVRFGRPPAGMWLPECAVDTETLELLVDEGIRFTILSPHSCARWRKMGAEEWIETGVDTRRSYRIALANGRSIAVFFYDGVVAQKVAFGEALADRDTFIGNLERAFDPEREGVQLVGVATDGETISAS
jgi:alpha-amylase/alpha-mannosidase (GH57 family)